MQERFPKYHKNQEAQVEKTTAVSTRDATNQTPILTRENKSWPPPKKVIDAKKTVVRRDTVVFNCAIGGRLRDKIHAMERNFEGPRPPETKEQNPPSPIAVEVNSYKTRGEPVSITIDGVTSQWHSVKGSTREETGNGVHEAYEILYNPESNRWLKIGPPHDTEQWETRLRRSVPIAKAACEIAGLPELADQMEDTYVTIRDEKVYGFLSPHIGQSMQHYIRETQNREENPEDVKELVSNVYEIACKQAQTLYKEYGYWADDANSGNILLHEKDGEYRVVLIDFSNKTQEKQLTIEAIPDHIAPDVRQKEAILEKRHEANSKILRNKFAKQCKIAGGEMTQEEPTKNNSVLVTV